MNILWTLFEIGTTFFQSLVIISFIYRFLSSKFSGRKNLILFLLNTCILFSVIITINHFSYFESVGIFIYCIVLFIISCICLKGNIFSKILVSIIPISGIALISSCTTHLVSVISGMSLFDIFTKQTIYRFITVIITQLLYFYLIFIILSIKRTSELSLHKSEWLLIADVFIISILIFLFLNLFVINCNPNEQGKLYILLAITGLIVINIVTCYLTGRLSRSKSLELENELLKKEQLFQSENLKSIKFQYEETQKIRHDFKNTLSVINSLIVNHDYASALSFTEKSSDSLNMLQKCIITNNAFVNAIFNSKLAQAIENQISVDFSSISDFENFDSIDLCNLIANLFDNAIESCQKSENSRKISFDILDIGDSIVLKMRNTKPGNFESLTLETSKTDKENHGLGTKIVKSIARKYNGIADFYIDDEYFCSNVVLCKK